MQVHILLNSLKNIIIDKNDLINLSGIKVLLIKKLNIIQLKLNHIMQKRTLVNFNVNVKLW